MDGKDKFNFTGELRWLKWVAVRGVIYDWAIYIGLETWSFEKVKRQGDKLYDEKHIRHLITCTDEVFALYRH